MTSDSKSEAEKVARAIAADVRASVPDPVIKPSLAYDPRWLVAIEALEAAAYKRGQEDMRERAAEASSDACRDDGDARVSSWAIRALPIMDPPQ